MQVNEDGSYNIYFAPQAPEGKESNWIPTGEDFFLLFRLYGPESKDFYKTWMLGDLDDVVRVGLRDIDCPICELDRPLMICR